MKRMFSGKMVSFRLLRSYSASNAKKLWIKHDENPSTQVSIKGCVDIDDFAEKVKQKLNAMEPINPGLKMEDFLKTKYSMKNSDESPLFVKTVVVTPYSVASKSICICDYDNSFRPLKSYTEISVESYLDIWKILRKDSSSGLFSITEPIKKITGFKQLKDGGKYGLFFCFAEKPHLDNQDMDKEVALAMKDYLRLNLGSNVTEMPIKVHGADENVWDAAFKVDDVLYLCVAKDIMCIGKLPMIPEKIKLFKERFQPHAQQEFSTGINKIVGVACGTYFPPLVRKQAHELGLVCVYLSGWRYEADKKLPDGFKIEYNSINEANELAQS